MRAPRWVRVVAILAATLVGCALTAFLLVPRLWPATTDGTSAGLIAATPAPTGIPHASATSSPTGPGEAPPSPPGPVVTALPAAPATVSIPPSAQPAALPAPTRLVVTRLGIDMAVEPTGVDANGQMGLPPDPATAGWYQWGSAPQDPSGAAVLAAHVDSKTHGIGPFVRLGSARAGDEIDVWVGVTKVVYRVSQVARVDKVTLDADGLFSLVGPPRLHLVTCTGDYVKGSGYTQNLVVVADRVQNPQDQGG